MYWWWLCIITLRPRQNGRHFPDDIFQISLNFVPMSPMNNFPALVQIMAWQRPGDKPLSEPMMVCLLTHLCVTRPQWVIKHFPGIGQSCGTISVISRDITRTLVYRSACLSVQIVLATRYNEYDSRMVERKIKLQQRNYRPSIFLFIQKRNLVLQGNKGQTDILTHWGRETHMCIGNLSHHWFR